MFSVRPRDLKAIEERSDKWISRMRRIFVNTLADVELMVGEVLALRICNSDLKRYISLAQLPLPPWTVGRDKKVAV